MHHIHMYDVLWGTELTTTLYDSLVLTVLQCCHTFTSAVMPWLLSNSFILSRWVDEANLPSHPFLCGSQKLHCWTVRRQTSRRRGLWKCAAWATMSLWSGMTGLQMASACFARCTQLRDMPAFTLTSLISRVRAPVSQWLLMVKKIIRSRLLCL